MLDALASREVYTGTVFPGSLHLDNISKVDFVLRKVMESCHPSHVMGSQFEDAKWKVLESHILYILP